MALKEPRSQLSEREAPPNAAMAGTRTAAAPPYRPLDRSFFARDPEEVARRLIGTLLISEAAEGVTGGIIVETEAYGGRDDAASHARAGVTTRTRPMFGSPGHAYVYLVYGMHSCLNAVARSAGEAGAVLIRALEPALGVELMRARTGKRPAAVARLAAGPALLCRALGVDRADNGLDLTAGDRLWIAAPDAPRAAIAGEMTILQGPRVGVGYAGPAWSSRPWRFGLAGSPALSRPFPAGASGPDRR